MKNTKKETSKDTHKNFIRISWEEALSVLEMALNDKYQAKGTIELKKDYGYDGVGNFYDAPTFVDIYLNEN